MSASRPLALISGGGWRCTVTLGMAVAAVRACERQLDAAVEAILDAPTTDAVVDASLRLNEIGDRLEAARNRRDRLIAELGGERWLWAVGTKAEAGFG